MNKSVSTLPKYPDVCVQLSGEDGNVFCIMGRVTKAMKKAGLHDEAKVFAADLMKTSSYDEALQFVMRTVNCE